MQLLDQKHDEILENLQEVGPHILRCGAGHTCSWRIVSLPILLIGW
jgi:hypothetical protein